MGRNRRQPGIKYLAITEWDKFLSNDWKHLNWKVDLALALLLVVLAAAVTKLFN